MALFEPHDTNTLYVSRTDIDDPLSSYAGYTFELDNLQWPSVEHYFQAMKFDGEQHKEKIRHAKTAKSARRLGRSRFQKIRSDWKALRETVMTRAAYIKCRSYPEIAQTLIDTGDQKIVERTMYDYFWGCGRDGRGHNTYGKILMNIRQKLIQDGHP